MLTPPIHRVAVRSNWRPPSTEKSASSTTCRQGPGQAAAATYANDWGEKSANFTSVKSRTRQGVERGRGTGGSAVAGLAEPIVGGVTGAGWPRAADAAINPALAANSALRLAEKNMRTPLGGLDGEAAQFNPSLGVCQMPVLMIVIVLALERRFRARAGAGAGARAREQLKTAGGSEAHFGSGRELDATSRNTI